MFRNRHTARSIFSSIVIYSFVFSGIVAFPQDLVASDDIMGGGASVFVFRGSRKKPQAKSSAGMGLASSGAGRGRLGGRRLDSAYAADVRKKKAAKRAGQTTASKGRPPATNPKIKLSNTLTAKADALLDNKQTDQAITTYREALKQNPKNANASSGLSEALTAKGIDAAGQANSTAGVVYLDEAVKLDPKNETAFAKLGEIFASNDQTERAIQNYEKALAIDPKLSAVYVPLGLLYLKVGEIAKADIYAGKAEAEGNSTADGQFLRGQVLLKQNKNAEAVAAFQKAQSLDPNYSSARYYEAVAYDRLNQEDKSIATLKGVVQSDPGFAPAWYDLGVAYYNKGEYQNSADAYQQSIRYDNKNAQAHANLASAYRQLERYPEANAEYKTAADTIKDNPDIYSEWGFCLGKTNEWDKSVARLIAARELSPKAIDNSNVGWAYYNSANAKTVAKNDAGAKADYQLGKAFLQKAVEQDPKLDAAYLNLGSTHNGLGEFQLAVSVLNVAVRLRRDWVVAINQLGLGYRGMNDLNSAIAQFQRATTLDANNVFGLFSLGEAYNASGNKKEAKKIQDRLKRINPAMATRLDNVLSGKAAVDAAKGKIEQKIPKIPRIPY